MQKWEQLNTIIRTQNEKELICILQGEKSKANAKLIAAAPDLLEALNGLLSWPNSNTETMHELRVKAVNAIKKATA